MFCRTEAKNETRLKFLNEVAIFFNKKEDKKRFAKLSNYPNTGYFQFIFMIKGSSMLIIRTFDLLFTFKILF
jgi:hypothetical protein